jgi:hypothetical protein
MFLCTFTYAYSIMEQKLEQLAVIDREHEAQLTKVQREYKQKLDAIERDYKQKKDKIEQKYNEKKMDLPCTLIAELYVLHKQFNGIFVIDDEVYIGPHSNYAPDQYYTKIFSQQSDKKNEFGNRIIRKKDTSPISFKYNVLSIEDFGKYNILINNHHINNYLPEKARNMNIIDYQMHNTELYVALLNRSMMDIYKINLVDKSPSLTDLQKLCEYIVTLSYGSLFVSNTCVFVDTMYTRNKIYSLHVYDKITRKITNNNSNICYISHVTDQYIYGSISISDVLQVESRPNSNNKSRPNSNNKSIQSNKIYNISDCHNSYFGTNIFVVTELIKFPDTQRIKIYKMIG